ncbi:hypothetical protein ATSB10_38080 [Dyella thiooxydans]|uniref:Outer membrane protein beta-barrel domain-containing protein n=1 Tax=Dyella thiooxydans TaxID=445710 RepID=A0A160N6E2_9GAMM|nr:outer membrane beta-barrel protein [Dyella thiooxydans]AND71262.1 hypothetical protein ATSB10_38080 [Dyella thiooxydans]
MSKRFTIAVAAMALSCISAGSLAATTSGQFFLNGTVGQSTWHDDGFNTSKTDTATAWRFGYAWNIDQVSYGFEAGYADLGKGKGTYYSGVGSSDLSGGATGPLAGVNMTYRFRNRMFVNARLGWMHDNVDFKIGGSSSSYSGDGGYAGVGVGYDINENFGVGVAYDRYNVRAQINGSRSQDGVDVFSGFAEVRF